MNRQRVAEASKGRGKPKVGGAFELIDHNGGNFSDGDLREGFSLVSQTGADYANLKNCDERIDGVRETQGIGDILTPAL